MHNYANNSITTRPHTPAAQELKIKKNILTSYNFYKSFIYTDTLGKSVLKGNTHQSESGSLIQTVFTLRDECGCRSPWLYLVVVVVHHAPQNSVELSPHLVRVGRGPSNSI